MVAFNKNNLFEKTVIYHIFFKSNLTLVLYPETCVDEGLNPRCHLIGTALERVVTALPGEDTTLQVGHHSYVAAIGTGNTGNVVVRAVGVGRIAGVVVLGHNVVAALLVGE